MIADGWIARGLAAFLHSLGRLLPLRRPDNPTLMDLLHEHLQGVGILLQLTGHRAQLSPNFRYLKGERIQSVSH